MPVASVKLSPGMFVTTAPSLIGSPVAFCPVPSPQEDAGPAFAVPDPEADRAFVEPAPPQAARANAAVATAAMQGHRRAWIRMFTASPHRDRGSDRARKKDPARQSRCAWSGVDSAGQPARWAAGQTPCLPGA